MKLLIRNLERCTKEEQLLSLFSEHGKVQSCTLVMDAKTHGSKGFAFVEMPKPGEAKAAMKTLNGLELDGRKIRVKKAQDKTSDNNTPEDTAAENEQTAAPKRNSLYKKTTSS
jgi:RNA recognition motif-containing protein